jgi:HK97 family phage major capsid protein/HK97 family phage prohead protease
MSELVTPTRPPRDDLVRAAPPRPLIVERRGDGEASVPVLHGWLARFNEWTEIDSVYEGHFLERLLPGCATKTLRENRPRMKVLVNHGRDPFIGEKPLGPIEILEERDAEGVWYEVPLLKTSYNDELIPGLEAGLYGTSFRFRIIREDFVDSPRRSEFNPDGIPERSIREMELFEFGPVTFPAYLGASAGLRSMTDDLVIEKLAGGDRERFSELVELVRGGRRNPSVSVAFSSTDEPANAAATSTSPNVRVAPEGGRIERAVEYVSDTPWAMYPGTIRTMTLILAERASGYRPSDEEVEERIGRVRRPVREASVPAAVKMIGLTGVIAPKASMINRTSGETGTGLDEFRAELAAALEDESVSAIVLDVDSPGGSVELVPETAAEILAARKQKPIVAVANTWAASAAYWLASAASEIVVTPSGEVGSIGVWSAHEDWSSFYEQKGIDTTLISAGKYKVEGNPFEPLGEEALAEKQRKVDAYYQMFLAGVAKGRKTSVPKVEANFGQGRMVMPNEALDAGMVDRIETLDETPARVAKPEERAALVELTKTRSVEVTIVGDPAALADAFGAAAIASHSTAVVDVPWDGPGNEAKMPNPCGAGRARRMYAWRDSSEGADPEIKASYKFPHHEVDGSGNPGAANVNGCRNGLARLPNAKIPEGDREGVRAHLQRHIDDFNRRSGAASASDSSASADGAGTESHPVLADVDAGTESHLDGEQSIDTREEASEMNVDELRARNAEITRRLNEIAGEYGAALLPAATQEEWDELKAEWAENDEAITSYEARMRDLAAIEGKGDGRMTDGRPEPSSRTRVGSGRRLVPDDPFDLSSYRGFARDEETYGRALRDGARTIIETAVFPHPEADRAKNVEHLERLLEIQAPDGEQVDFESSAVARRIIMTGSPLYRKAFGKAITFRSLTATEQAALANAERALSIGTGSQGGMAVPYTLDPTLILSSDGAVNPLRLVSRVERITGNEWRGVSTTGVTASYDAEAQEVSDDTPTLAQPIANVEKAQVFVPYSIEVEGDWAGMQTELATITQDEKDRLEAQKFLLGLGHASIEPEGLLIGSTTDYVTAANNAVTADDIYGFGDSLPERFQGRASILGSRFFSSVVRKLDTSGGGALWARIGEGIPPRLLDHPFYVASYFDASIAAGKQLATIGDYRYFLIVDRIGMNVEIVQHLIGANRRPTGQRGFYAYWRNTSKVLVNNAFRTLRVKT